VHPLNAAFEPAKYEREISMLKKKTFLSILGGLAVFVLILGSASAVTKNSRGRAPNIRRYIRSDVAGISEWEPYPSPPGQTPIPAASIPQFVEPLPILEATGASNGTIQTIVAGKSQIDIEMREFKSRMLPDNFIQGYDGTWVWGYV
jgi:hypothetical protein